MPQPRVYYNYRATVANIVDADTVDLMVDLGFHTFMKTRFRLSGIDAPERFTIEGKSATAYLASLIPVGSSIVIETELDKSDKYGRYLCTILTENVTTVNDLMVNAGHAVYRSY